jgi:hypothetical protein
MVAIAHFLADISVEPHNGHVVSDPVFEILESIKAHLETPESVATIKATLAIIDCWGGIDKGDVEALSSRTRAALNEFAKRRLRLRYSEAELNSFAKELDACLARD